MKKIVVVLILSIVIIVMVLVLSFGGETKDVTVLGITLGKSLREEGIPECKYKNPLKYDPTYKSYDYTDSDCYREGDPVVYGKTTCFTEVIRKLSFPVTIYVTFLGKCDRQSPVQEIQVTFNSDNYSNMMLLMTDKFGFPTKKEKSSVQNRMGAKFEKLEAFWNVGGCSIYLSNIGSKVNRGFLMITHPDKVRQDAEESRKKGKSDRDKF